MGITVYVDSYSVHEWTKLVDSVGPISMTVSGYSVADVLDDIQEISGIESAEIIEYTNGEMLNLNYSGPDEWGYYSSWCRLGVPSEDYMTAFQGAYEFISGHIPETEDDIVLHHRFATELNARVGDIVAFTQHEGTAIGTLYLEVVGTYSYISETEEMTYYGYYESMNAFVIHSYSDLVTEDITIDIGVDQKVDLVIPFIYDYAFQESFDADSLLHFLKQYKEIKPNIKENKTPKNKQN